jgi:molybdate transport system ATP-binding protein
MIKMSIEVRLKKKVKGFTLDVDFNFSGGVLGILGASGSGKSMTLKCIAGVMTPDEGRIVINGHVLFDSEKKINLPPQQRHVGLLFQDYALFPHMTVSENIQLAIKKTPHNDTMVKAFLERFQISTLATKYPAEISGGQQQRAALARALVTKPDVLLLDEPFSALDPHLRDHMRDTVSSDIKDYTGDVILVSHNRSEIYSMCSHMLIMHHGKILIQGSTHEVFTHPKSRLAAQLTGCKNFCTAIVTSEDTLIAKEWGITLTLDTPRSKEGSTIGVRARHLKFIEPNKHSDINCFPCIVEKTTEDVFEFILYLRLKPRDANHTGDPIVMITDKSTWQAWPYKDNLYVYMSPQSILTLV